MKELVINGVTYVKAIEIAKHLGYTSDYVGQLCRAGKVVAQKVGHSWYVRPDTIDNHKKSRYRSNQIKSREAVKPYRLALARRTTQLPTKRVVVHCYEMDDADLRPTPKKPNPHVFTPTSNVETTPPTSQPTQIKIEKKLAPQSTQPSKKIAKIRSSETLSIARATDQTQAIKLTQTRPPHTKNKNSVPASRQHPSVATAHARPTNPKKTARVALARPPRSLKRTLIQTGWHGTFFLCVCGLFVLLFTVAELSWRYDGEVITAGLTFEHTNLASLFSVWRLPW